MATRESEQVQRIAGNVRSALEKISTKGVAVPVGANSDDLETLIGQIDQSGGGGTDTTIPADEAATSNDMRAGKSAYVNGEKVEGGLEVISSVVELDEYNPIWNPNKGAVRTYFTAIDADLILNEGVRVYTDIMGDALGDATPSDVNEGVTFTSKEGLELVGTRKDSGGGGVELPTLSSPGSAADLRSGKQLIDADGNTVTGTMVDVVVPTPSISVSSAGLITASATQSSGYTPGGTKSGTKQLTTRAAQTITPGTSNKTIASNIYLTGTQTIKGDSNLVAGNIKKGVSIFGVAGSYEGDGGGDSGGGLPAGVSALVAGTVTPTEDNTSGVIVTHSLGVVPNFCAWFVAESYSGGVATSVAVAGAIINKASKYTSSSSISYNIHYVIDGYSSSSQQTTTSGRVSNQTYLTATQARLVCNSNYKIKAGKQINWVVGVVDGVL